MTSDSEHDASFVAFVEARRPYLRRAAYALCGDWNQAEDILQIAFVKLYLSWPRLLRRGQEEAYVRRVLFTVSIDETRRPWRRERPGLDHVEHPRSEVDAYEPTAVTRALQELPLKQRQVLVLRHIFEFSVKETAQELGIGEGTVKSHSSRGLHAMQRALATTPSPTPRNPSATHEQFDLPGQ